MAWYCYIKDVLLQTQEVKFLPNARPVGVWAPFVVVLVPAHHVEEEKEGWLVRCCRQAHELHTSFEAIAPAIQ